MANETTPKRRFDTRFWSNVLANNSRQGDEYAFNLTVLIAAVFGLGLPAAPESYNCILVLKALTGLGVGGNIPIDVVICMGFIPLVGCDSGIIFC